MKSNLVEIEVYPHHQTGKAYLVSDDGIRANAKWLPKSSCELELRGGKDYGQLTLPEPMALDKGLF